MQDTGGATAHFGDAEDKTKMAEITPTLKDIGHSGRRMQRTRPRWQKITPTLQDIEQSGTKDDKTKMEVHTDMAGTGRIDNTIRREIDMS